MAIYPDKKNGRLTGRFRVEVQKSGRRLRGRFDTLVEAKKAETDFATRLTSGSPQGKLRVDARATPQTLEDAFQVALGSLWKTDSAFEGAQRTFRTLPSTLATRKLQDLSTEDIDGYIAHLYRERERKAGTVNRRLSFLHKLLAWAHRRKYLPEMPHFEWQAEGEGRIRWLSQVEEHTVLKLLTDLGAPDVADLVAVALDTGMRRGEMVGLEPAQVDSGYVRLWKTKTKSPRSIPLTPRARAILETGDFPWGVNPSRIRWFWDRARAEMNLDNDPWFTLHACRHTTATRLVQAGTNLRVIQKFMGHRSIQTTLRYAHVQDNLLEDAAAALSHLGATPVIASPTKTLEGERGENPRLSL